MGGLRIILVCLIGLVAVLGAQAVLLPTDPKPRTEEAKAIANDIVSGPRFLPEGFRIQPPIKLLQPWDTDSLQGVEPRLITMEDKPISQVRLIEGDYLVADWRGGRLQYRLKGVNPWGASVGGHLSTSTAKATLTWSLGN